MSFGARLAAAMERHGPLCVGIDPHVSLLSQWGLPDTPDGLAAFSDTVVTAAAGSAAAIKPNAAFYERHGSRGIAVLERLLADAREADLLTVMDAKRGDIGSTMAGYADAFLRPGSPLEADSLTVSPYLGFGSLKPALDLAAETGKGIFVLALTSNPEGHEVQHARTASGEAVAAAVVRQASALNEGAEPMGNVGLVVGATVGSAVSDLGIGLDGLNGPILAPGVGAQGAGPDELAQVFGNSRSRVLVNQSRGVLAEGPSLERLRSAVRDASDAAQAALEG
ncbi:orotidine-5'-phosphate decarboxylase [Demequina sp. NBRC 110057]|uniref:orotidine-5'-phosphate decarboxylase n=1 Tax=Demequina sp. NBRC 110057 TaxID=1570346 RepID=UPI000A043850|nr:orotidine-5'-phosphate decarboxylase [Demequina sp. NBRC 110057]